MKTKRTLLIILLLTIILKFITPLFNKIFSQEIVKTMLIRWTFYLNIILFLILIFILIISRRELIKPLKIIKKKTIFFLIIILIISLYIKVFLSPFFDPARSGGWEYKLTARNLLEHQEYELCIAGSLYECEIKGLSDHNAGFPFFLSTLFLIFGITESIVIPLNIILGVLTSALIFILAYVLLKNEIVSLFSALIFSVMPIHTIYSGTGEITSFMLFFITSSFLLMSYYLIKPSVKLFAASAVLVAFTINIQITNVSLLPILFLLLIITWNKLRKNKLGYIILIIIAFLTLTPYLYLLTKPIAYSEGVFVSPKYFSRNLNTFFNENYNSIPIITILLFVIGFFSAFKNKNTKLTIIPWIVFYLGLYCLLFSPHMERYTVDIYPAVAIISALGTIFILKSIFNNLKSRRKVLVYSLFICIIVFSSISPRNLITYHKLHLNYKEYSSSWWENISEFKSILMNIPKNSLIVTSTDTEARIAMFKTNNKIIALRVALISSWIDIQKKNNEIFFIKTSRDTSDEINLEQFLYYFNLNIDKLSNEKIIVFSNV